MLSNINKSIRKLHSNKLFFSHNIIPKTKIFTFNKISEKVLNLSNINLRQCHDIIGNNTISVLGYGPQGRGQALNLKDNNFPVILGLRKNGLSWKKSYR